ncbi:hypothetical protein [Bremerella cremea]|uniref:hypothetical protein n=1 Tax=Bremerella cremea TaxID=1031537 RepID=UPI0031E9469C
MTKRRYPFRLSLKGLFALVAVAAVLIACVLAMTPRDEKALSIRLAGYGLAVGKFINTHQGLFRQTVMEVTVVRMEPGNFPPPREDGRIVLSPELIADVQKCETLHILELPQTTLTSDDLLAANSLDELESLVLSDTLVDDRLLSRLAGSAKLKEISLMGSRVTPAGVVKLADCPNLQWLWLDTTMIDEASLRAIAQMPDLVSLSIRGQRSDIDDDRWPADSARTLPPETIARLAAGKLEVLAVPCKPANLPLDALRQSSINTLTIYWTPEYDADDDQATKAIQAGPNTITLCLFPDG